MDPVRRPDRGSAAPKVVRIGATYRDLSTNDRVVALDHEIRRGRRTGRIVVRPAEPGPGFSRRFLSWAEDLVEEAGRPEGG